MLDFSCRMKVPRSFLFLLSLLLTACAGQLGGPVTIIDTPQTIQQDLVYDGAITLAIKNGQTLPGTNIAYNGRTPDGRANLSVAGLPAPKSSADSVNFVGSPAPGAVVNLNTRVTTYDSAQVNLFGTIHVVISNPQPQPGAAAAQTVTAYAIPVNYNVTGGERVPGSLIEYKGKSDQGAEFTNVGGFPFRQQFDSVVWDGRLREKIALRLDLRVLNFSDDAATLVGTAKLIFEQ
jgi:hypothetical protein